MLVLLAFGALLSGCKKEEEDKPTLSGSVKFASLPAYVQKGDSFHIVATGSYRGSDVNDTLVGYRMYDPILAVYDTLRAENEEGVAEGDFVISRDTLGSFSLSVYAYADGYYGDSYSSSFTVVNPTLDTLKGSLTGHPFGYEATTSFTDDRDGQTYYASSLASGGWMLQNLAWAGAGYPFANSEAMNYIAGRYYNWDEAKTACPTGWRLPSDTDFVALAGAGAVGQPIPGKAGSLKADVYFNGTQLWTYQNNTITLTNDDYFTAIPWGYLVISAGVLSFRQYGGMAVFWTSDSPDADTALVRHVNVDSNDIFVQAMDKKSFRASVRCVKE